MTKIWKPLALMAVTGALLAGCAQGTSTGTSDNPASDTTHETDAEETTGTADGAPSGEKQRIILIGNQAFGDHGPMDDMSAALASCQADFGVETKELAVLDAADYQNAINGAASDGYDLIITTFPQMTAATVTTAKANPNTSFAAVYQFVNVGDEDPVANIWDSSYDVSGAAYAEGAIAAQLSESGKLGIIVGDLDPTLNAIINAFIQGAESINPDVSVKWANAATFGDPAKGKDLATAMISGGIDVIATDAAQTQLGAIDAAKEGQVLVFGDNGDNSALYPEGFVSDLRAELGKTVYDACNSFVGGSFKGGEHTVYDLSNGGAGLDTSLITRWGEASGRADDASAALTLYESTVAGIADGSIEVVNDPTTPN